MTSSQIVNIEKTSCNFEELYLLNEKKIFLYSVLMFWNKKKSFRRYVIRFL